MRLKPTRAGALKAEVLKSLDELIMQAPEDLTNRYSPRYQEYYRVGCGTQKELVDYIDKMETRRLIIGNTSLRLIFEERRLKEVRKHVKALPEECFLPAGAF